MKRIMILGLLLTLSACGSSAFGPSPAPAPTPAPTVVPVPDTTAWVNDPAGTGRCLLIGGATVSASCYATPNR